MARWKLTEPHYLRVPGTKWEYQEVDRKTGRPKRSQYDVPLHLDPKLEVDWNYRPNVNEDGEITVALEGTKHEPYDIIFQGTPTPGMLPLDDEARAITAEYSKGNWTPTEGLEPEQQNASYTNKMLSGFIDEITALRDNAREQSAHGQGEFMSTMVQMMQQQTEILGRLVNGQASRVQSSPVEDRVERGSEPETSRGDPRRFQPRSFTKRQESKPQA